VLSKVAYLTLCRSIRLLALLVRGDGAKNLEILVLRHQLAVLRRQVARLRLEPADRALLAAVSRVLFRADWSCFLVKPETLLRWHRRLVAGVWNLPSWSGTTAIGSGGAAADRPPSQGEPAVGLPAHPRRAATARHPGLCIRNPRHPPPARPRPRTAADRHLVAGVPEAAGRRDRGVRLLHRRHHLAAAAVCAVLHRAGHPPGAPGRGDRQPRRRLGRPAGPQPHARAGRPGPTGALPTS
jgi:hypothetical protein